MSILWWDKSDWRDVASAGALFWRTRPLFSKGSILPLLLEFIRLADWPLSSLLPVDGRLFKGVGGGRGGLVDGRGGLVTGLVVGLLVGRGGLGGLVAC